MALVHDLFLIMTSLINRGPHRIFDKVHHMFFIDNEVYLYFGHMYHLQFYLWILSTVYPKEYAKRHDFLLS